MRTGQQHCCGFKITFTVVNEIRLAAWLLLLIFFLIVISLTIVDLSSGKVTVAGVDNNKYYVAITISGCFSLAATFITLWQVRLHKQSYNYPFVQGKMIRIIMMVPIYAWAAWIGLIFVELAVYIDFIRACYEAFVIYNFLLLLTTYMGGEDHTVLILQSKQPPISPWPQPLCCFGKASLNRGWLSHIKRGTLQYGIFTPLCAFAAVICGVFNVYNNGVIDFTAGYIYIALVQNATQLVALYSLIWFYWVTRDSIAAFKPLSQFLVVKAVVFFTFWQGILLDIIAYFNVIQNTGSFTAAEIQLGLQDFIICIEMFVAAVVHRFTFPPEPFRKNGQFIHQFRAILGKHNLEFPEGYCVDPDIVNSPTAFPKQSEASRDNSNDSTGAEIQLLKSATATTT